MSLFSIEKGDSLTLLDNEKGGFLSYKEEGLFLLYIEKRDGLSPL